MGANLMYSPLESVFEATMQREGRLLTTYSSGTEFRAFFRIRNDIENQRETIVIYYDVTAPVHSGTLVRIGNEVFLALNKETVENDVYYKSTLIKCNGIYNENNGMIHSIPFYSDNMKSSVSVGNNIISMLNGNVELLMEENSLTKQIQINDFFNEFNRTFKVTNKYTIDGITHLIAEVQADQKPNVVFSVEIDGLSSYVAEPNTTIQLTATPYINGGITTGATFDWTSSDNSIAKVDNTGKVTFISEGEVEITVVWMERNVMDTTNTIIVTNDANVEVWTMTIKGKEDLKIGFARTYTFVTMVNGEETYLSGVEYEIINQSVPIDFVTEDFDTGNNTLKLLVEDDDLYDETFTIRAYHTEKDIEALMNIRLESLY
ncbi:MAG: Ig-like domain-containing protein [Lachnospiraceae bacterium]|nr:Ig-like domain-containing protein [Lachnospiraceae bacterium]